MTGSISMLQDHLSLAEKHVAIGEKNIAKQRALLDELARDGHDIAMAQQLLAQFEDLQALHVADRDRIRAELAEATE